MEAANVTVDVVAYNNAIAACAKGGDWEQAWAVFSSETMLSPLYGGSDASSACLQNARKYDAMLCSMYLLLVTHDIHSCSIVVAAITFRPA